ncbi:VWA domain-containing protein [Terriglobus albidus]|uniref:VWA domain-containing protein n=1 Tax=Terriglobus albidus TaxID=1592106 RepID=UPI0021E0B216|nr:VWA domain-containing protein [Terriglobus albidus]
MSLQHLLPVLVLGLGLPALSQQEQPEFRLQVNSRLISTTLTVRDANGKLVTNLPQTAFHIKEDGIDQTVRYYASQRELPLSIALIVDASGSQDKFVKEHEHEIEDFLREVMEPRDRAFAICFGNHLRLVSDWTSSPVAITDTVHRFNKGERNFPEIGPKEERELGTALYDAVYFSITEKMEAEREHRRVLIVFSDGEENSSEHDLIDAITAAQGADTLVYALRTTENKEKKMNARDRYGMRVLDHLTEATGGQSFDVRKESSKEIFAAIAADLKSLYEIGYYSNNPAHDRRFRKVTITAGEGMVVRAREGYAPR